MSFTNKSKILTYVLIALIPLAGLTGWLITKNVLQQGETYTLNIAGSTTVFKIVNDAKNNFSTTHPGVIITVAGTGSGAGITALIDGQIDIAMSSRPVKSSENATAGNTLKAFAVAKDGLSIIVHESANLLDITLDEARAIFNGTVTDWSDPIVAAAGLTGTIQLVVREEGSGTRDAFNELVMGDEKQLEAGSAYPGTELAKSSNQLIVDAVAANTNYIGYVGLGYVDERVDAVFIEGIEPTIETVQDATYLIQRELYLVTNGTPTGIACEFINWLFSPVGQSIVVDSGFINVLPTKEELF
ncbi:MAG: phosphate ABC transporter substrate-binding protein [Candidatus Heimdallarchaeota archaeon]|nr:phosphate ABC transporter substrate-binding protein [Candidatus Heimdallarchaeota archaeon]